MVHFSLRELHLENQSRKKLALSKKTDMRNHMQMTEVREGAPRNRETMWGLQSVWIPWMNSRVSSGRNGRRAVPKEFFCPDKKLIQTLSLRRSITQDLRTTIQSIETRIFYEFSWCFIYIDEVDLLIRSFELIRLHHLNLVEKVW